MDDEDFKVPIISDEEYDSIDKSYHYTVFCKKCTLPIILLPDESKGKVKYMVGMVDKFNISCENPDCRYEDCYDLGEIESLPAH